VKPRSQHHARPLSFIEFVSRLGVRLTPAQMTVALVAFDGIQPKHLPPEYRKLARQLFGDVDTIPALAWAVFVAVCGARSGKTYCLCALRLLHLAWTVGLGGLAPGEEAVGLIVAPDLKLARHALRFVTGVLENSNLTPHVVGHTSDNVTIRRPDGHLVRIECQPATRGGSAVRGQSLVGAVLDECSLFRDVNAIVNDQEVYLAVSPRILKDGQVILASTPWARTGLLFEMFRDNYGKPQTALAVHAPTALMRNFDPVVMSLIERERLRNEPNYRREYLAEFADLQTSLLVGADVDAAVDTGTKERAYRSECVYAVTADVGLKHDPTCAMVFHLESRSRDGGPPAVTLVIDAIRHLAPRLLHRRITLDEVDKVLGDLCNLYRVNKVHGDSREAGGLAVLLRARGIEFIECSMSLPEQERRAVGLSHRFAARTVRILDDPILVLQCKESTIKRRAGGQVAIEGRGTKHDDAFDCLMLSTSVVLPSSGGNIECTTSVFVGDGSVAVTSVWRERHVSPDGSVRWTPSSPPVGSAEWVESRRELAAEGVFPMNEPDFRPFASNDFK
jgi:hypothetical protein